jgi:hypothetical protein
MARAANKQLLPVYNKPWSTTRCGCSATASSGASISAQPERSNPMEFLPKSHLLGLLDAVENVMRGSLTIDVARLHPDGYQIATARNQIGNTLRYGMPILCHWRAFGPSRGASADHQSKVRSPMPAVSCGRSV